MNHILQLLHFPNTVIVSILLFKALNQILCQSVDQGDVLSCLSMVCNFESGNLCNYQNVENGETTTTGSWKKFNVYTRAYRNLATGVRIPVEGSAFASTYLKPGDRAMIESQGTLKSDGIRYIFPLPADRIVRFRVYKVADQMELKGCCDTITNCPYSTNRDVKITDFNKWKIASFLCKAGTQKIVFYGINGGLNEGAIGLDDIQLYLPSYSTADKADSNACFRSSENSNNGGGGGSQVVVVPNQVAWGNSGQTNSQGPSNSNNGEINGSSWMGPAPIESSGSGGVNPSNGGSWGQSGNPSNGGTNSGWSNLPASSNSNSQSNIEQSSNNNRAAKPNGENFPSAGGSLNGGVNSQRNFPASNGGTNIPNNNNGALVESTNSNMRNSANNVNSRADSADKSIIVINMADQNNAMPLR